MGAPGGFDRVVCLIPQLVWLTVALPPDTGHRFTVGFGRTALSRQGLVAVSFMIRKPPITLENILKPVRVVLSHSVCSGLAISNSKNAAKHHQPKDQSQKTDDKKYPPASTMAGDIKVQRGNYFAARAALVKAFIRHGCKLPSCGVCPCRGSGGTPKNSSPQGSSTLSRRSNFVSKDKPAKA